MKQQIVASLSAAALVAFAFAAYAAPDNAQQGGPPPSASQPSSPGGAAGPSETQGGGQYKTDRGAAESGGPDGPQTGERSGKQEKERNKSAETGDKAGKDRDRKSAETGDKDQMDRDRKSAETGDKDRDGKSAETGDRDRDRKAGDQATVRIDSGQKEKVRTYFSEHRPTANRIEKSRVSVSIGVALPVGIALAPLPPDIIVVAADCPLQYFVWGDDVVLVDSCSREVVDIIPNIG